MLTHEDFKAEMMKRPGVRAEVERLEREEMPILDEILAARKAAGLTQAQVAERMGSTAPAVSRLEDALVTGKHSPSLATLRKYAAALGKRIEVHLV
ncbi:MAG: helix-turn-helix transcriptional regulator [Glaciimonas sp.]|nr:helix-turn-helix transcriptional regulator [Glaciimonas sp.]